LGKVNLHIQPVTVQEGEPLMELVTLAYVLLIVASAKAVGELVTRFSQPTIVGELLAGIVLGPFVLGAVFTGLADMY